MKKDKPLINRVANSGIITINLEDYYPTESLLVFDLTEYLFRGLILREKDFREALAVHNWEQYRNKNLSVCCSSDAIVPIWAFQLVTIHAEPYANNIIFGDEKDFLAAYYYKTLQALNLEQFKDKHFPYSSLSIASLSQTHAGQ